MNMPTQAQIDSLLRQGYTAGGTAFTIAAMLAIIPQDAVQPAIVALHQIGDGLKQALGGFSNLIIIFGPIIMGLSAKAAAFAVSLKSQIKGVHAASPQDLMNAVASQTPGTLAKAAAALPGVQVMVSGVASQSLRSLAADPSQPDIVAAVRTTPTPPPTSQRP